MFSQAMTLVCPTSVLNIEYRRYIGWQIIYRIPDIGWYIAIWY